MQTDDTVPLVVIDSLSVLRERSEERIPREQADEILEKLMSVQPSALPITALMPSFPVHSWLWPSAMRALNAGKTIMYLDIETSRATFMDRAEELLCLRK